MNLSIFGIGNRLFKTILYLLCSLYKSLTFRIRHGIRTTRLISLKSLIRANGKINAITLWRQSNRTQSIPFNLKRVVNMESPVAAVTPAKLEQDLMFLPLLRKTVKIIKYVINLFECIHWRVADNFYYKIMLFCLLLSTLWSSSNCLHGTVKLSSNTIKTKYGLLRGIVVRSSPIVEAYLGIPYASPPVGSLRFMPPITPSTWKNVRIADRFSPVCPQKIPIPPNGPEALLEVPRARLSQLRRLLPLLQNQSEDCLYLNIYVPVVPRRKRRFTPNKSQTYDSPELSTVIYIHGESYEWNSGNPYDGSELAAHGNVIVVTINFRLGIFGFLKTGGKESAQGNFGLMDLVAGLHWLKENLPSFGGNPNSITLFGHGTGAALANILMVSPVASDLILRAVLASGSALSPWAIQKNPLFVKRRVAEQTGCHGDMMYDDLAPCLRTKTVPELLAVSIDYPRFLMGFAPFIDGTVIAHSSDSFGSTVLPFGSALVSTSGIEYANFPKRNLIFSLTSVESYLDLSAQDLEFGFNETRRDRILRTFVRNNYHYHLNEIFAVLKNEYTDWEKAIRNPLSSRDATLSFLSDGHTASALIKLGYLHSLRGGKSYFVHFQHKTVQEEYPQRFGSVRGEDVPFWLGLPISPLFPYNYTTQEKKVGRLMLRYLANFIKTGDPNQFALPSTSLPLPSTSVAPKPVNYQVWKKNTTQRLDSSFSKNYKSNEQRVKRMSNLNENTHIFSSIKSSPEDETKVNNSKSLEIIYNQHRSNAMRDKRTNRRHLRSNDLVTDNDISFNADLETSQLPYWDAYDVVNQLYLELGLKTEIQSHYRGHKLSMWLNLIPQLHRHSNINDQSMRHHHFLDDLNSRDLYEGVVRPQLQTRPTNDDDISIPKTTTSSKSISTNASFNNRSESKVTTTECGIDGALFVSEQTTQIPSYNESSVDSDKYTTTGSIGLIGNLEILRRLSSKQFQSYTTALVATVAVGCFLLILNVLIFAGIYYQREKRARDAKTKEELQDSNLIKNAHLKHNAFGSEGSDSLVGIAGCSKTQVVFGEYNCYDEKSRQENDSKTLSDIQSQKQGCKIDSDWNSACSTNTLDLLKTKHCNPLAVNFVVTAERSDSNVHTKNTIEKSSYNQVPVTAVLEASDSNQVTHFDYAVQSSDKMSFKEIEKAVKVISSTNDITEVDDIPEPPPPPKIYQSSQQHHNSILRQSTGSVTQSGTSGSKKRVHIQEISV